MQQIQIMNVDRLETHDRLEHFINDQWETISQGAEDCLKKNPDSLALQEKSPYIYILAHPRTHDDGVNKRLLWQPRITRPNAQTNSYLFRAPSHSDTITICWMIPPKEIWGQYRKGNVCESDIVLWSINQFQYNRDELERPDINDLPDERAREIWMDFLRHRKK